MKRLLLAGVASLATLSAAQAADIVEPTAYDWTGAYVGLQGGYGWGDNDVKPDANEQVQSRSSVTFHPLDDGSIKMEGFLGGLHAGYNWQSDSLVLGLEGDIEFADIDGDTDIIHADDGNAKVGEARQKIDWLGSLRLRAGFAFDRALLYATGGLAAGGVKVSGEISDDGDFDSSNKNTEWGWTVGAGLEYAFTDEFSGLVEYRYTDLGDSDVDVDHWAISKLDFENTFNAVRVGLSWHFLP